MTATLAAMVFLNGLIWGVALARHFWRWVDRCVEREERDGT